MGTRILMYHGIFKNRDEIFGSSREWVHVSTFEEHCKFLKDEGYNSISMEEFLLKKESGNLSPQDIVITFDDAAIGQFRHALPILKHYHLKATFYVPVLWLNKPKRFSDDDLKTLIDEGMEIGSHSMSHPDFRLINSETMKQELKESKKYLERIISKPVNHFSFPFGRSKNIDNAILSAEGYETAVTVDRGVNKTHTDKYRLYRIGIYSFTDINLFKKYLNQHYFIKYYFMRYTGDLLENIIGKKMRKTISRFVHKILETKRFK